VVTVEGGGEELGIGGVGKHVSGDLFDGELIKGHIFTEGIDDPVTPGPVRAGAVDLVTVGVGVAAGIEPEESHALGVGAGGEEGVDKFFVGSVLFEFSELGRGGLKPGESKGGAAGEDGEIGLGRRIEFFFGEAFLDKVVDGVCVGRDGRFFWEDEAPVVFVLGALLDPLFDKLFFLVGE